MSARALASPSSLATAVKRGAVLALALVVAGACSGTAATGGGAACTYGQTIHCTGEGPCSGLQTCLPDLTGYGPCECGDGGARDAGRDAPGDS